MMGNCRLKPAERMAGAHCATAEATRRQVESTPMTGVSGRAVWTSLGRYLLAAMPTMMGARTTWMHETAMPVEIGEVSE